MYIPHSEFGGLLLALGYMYIIFNKTRRRPDTLPVLSVWWVPFQMSLFLGIATLLEYYFKRFQGEGRSTSWNVYSDPLSSSKIFQAKNQQDSLSLRVKWQNKCSNFSFKIIEDFGFKKNANHFFLDEGNLVVIWIRSKYRDFLCFCTAMQLQWFSTCAPSVGYL